jgi:hypothetical protein
MKYSYNSIVHEGHRACYAGDLPVQVRVCHSSSVREGLGTATCMILSDPRPCFFICKQVKGTGRVLLLR